MGGREGQGCRRTRPERQKLALGTTSHAVGEGAGACKGGGALPVRPLHTAVTDWNQKTPWRLHLQAAHGGARNSQIQLFTHRINLHF